MTTDKPTIGLGLIGTGFMGLTHSIGFGIAERVFNLPYRIERRLLADVSIDAADRANRSFGFAGTTGDWRDVIADPAIDIVDITAPNSLHYEMAMAAIAAGKHVYCEKPLAPTAPVAGEMADAATSAGIVTQVGFNYQKNPMFTLARTIIESGDLGEITGYRAVHAEDYMADPAQPWYWRFDPEGGGGAFADLGSHTVATARFLLGPVAEVFGATATAIAERPIAPGATEKRPVEVEDIARALVRFECGATGSLEANWIATGRKMQHDFEVYGTKGSLAFTQERLNELRLFTADGPSERRGYRTIHAGPDHPPYGDFCVASGHQLGFNDLKAIEIRDFLAAVAGEAGQTADFAEAYEIQKVVDAVYRSAKSDAWLTI